MPQRGRYASRVLGLDVQVEGERLRFYAGTALLLESEELIERLEAMVEEEARRREEAEREVARLREELARSKR